MNRLSESDDTEWPPMNIKTLGVVLAVVALAMWVSSILPMGWAA